MRWSRLLERDRRRIAIVVQRYGAGITGGAEQLARAVALRLALRHEVTVLTTCASDHRTWRNDLPAGPSQDEAVRVVRFPTSRERVADFDAWVADFYRGSPHTPATEREFLDRQGPVVPALLSHLQINGTGYDAVIFYTYLYWPTVLGMPVVGNRSLFVPTAHDEPAIHLSLYRTVFEAAGSFVFLSREERALVRRLFPGASSREMIASIGIEIDPVADPERFHRRYGADGPYLLYVGRVEQGKGVGSLIEAARALRRSVLPDLSLVLLGGHGMRMPEEDWIVAPGFVDEQTKRDAIAGCLALVSPSIHESLGISVLEAWAEARPVIADGRSAVVRDHCTVGHGGLWYEGAAELISCVRWLFEHPADAAALGRNGQRFVAANFTWPEVINRYERLISMIADPTTT